MAGFLYFVDKPFVPNLQEFLSTKELVSVGLAHLAEVTGRKLRNGPEWSLQPCDHGPNGTKGFVLTTKRTDQPDPPNLQYVASRQEWIEAAGRWIGWNREQPPTPEDIRRQHTADGATVSDLFGREWRIPIARLTAEPLGRLSAYQAMENGKAMRRLHRFELDLWNAAEAIAPRLLDDATPIANEELVRLVALALGRNYRLSDLEQAAFAAMGEAALDETFCTNVALVVCHVDFVLGLQKKTPA